MGQHQHHHSSGPFTEEQQILLRLGQQKDLFSGHHHHHHHHSSAKYQRPKQITTPIGLYALKKLNAIQPTYLTVRQKRLLEPVAPGLISYLFYGGYIGTMCAYSLYVFKSVGYQGLISKAMLPVFAMGVGYKVLEYGLNQGRQLLFSRQRTALVQKYTHKLGKQYMLDVLDPNFRLDAPTHVEHAHH